MKFYMVMDGQRKGPFPLEELAAQGLERDTLVWHTGLHDWRQADRVPALQDVIATIPPPVPDINDEQSYRELPEPDYTPAAFQRLYFWWFVFFVATFLMPL